MAVDESKVRRILVIYKVKNRVFSLYGLLISS